MGDSRSSGRGGTILILIGLLGGIMALFIVFRILGSSMPIPGPRSSAGEPPGASLHGTVESTPGDRSGSARVAGTRIPARVLVEARDLGVPEAELLRNYPTLAASNRTDAGDYASVHRNEIGAAIHRNNEVARPLVSFHADED